MINEQDNNSISCLMNGVLKSITLLNKEIEEHFGMSSARISTLLAFTEKSVMRMNELSKAMALNTSTSTRMVDGLVKDGFVDRLYDKVDRRIVAVELTVKGKKKTKDIKQFRDMYFKSIKYKVKDKGKEEMLLSLKTLIEAYESFKLKL